MKVNAARTEHAARTVGCYNRSVARAASTLASFPPAPSGMKGRDQELATLAAWVRDAAPARLALVGSGGSGKSMLAAALGHALSPRFEGRVHWFRVGAWDYYTLTEMLALGLGTTTGDGRVEALQTLLREGAPRLIFLDNHEDDRAMARLLDGFVDSRASFVLTARRCLLSGVWIYPVTAPLVASGDVAFPRVAPLTRVLRHNPLALDIADGLVGSGEIPVAALLAHLLEVGVTRVRAIEHEDDLPEVARLVEWAFARLPAASRRMLAVLAHCDGDHVDRDSLLGLARAKRGGAEALELLLRWRLIQEPLAGRFAVHAVVRHALRRLGTFPAAAFFEHYVRLLEREPGRLELEYSHLFAAMDHAHRGGDLASVLRVQRLLTKLGER